MYILRAGEGNEKLAHQAPAFSHIIKQTIQAEFSENTKYLIHSSILEQ
jgi:hypothetical protein